MTSWTWKKKTKRLFGASGTIHTTTQRHRLLRRCPHFKPRWLTAVCYCYLKTIIVIISIMALHLISFILFLLLLLYIFNCKWVDTRWQQCGYIYTKTVHRIQRTKHT